MSSNHEAQLVMCMPNGVFPLKSGVYRPDGDDGHFEYALNAGVHLITFRPRDRVEESAAFRHFASYCVVQDQDRRFLTYRRPDKGEGDSRLKGKVSIGFGGHVEAKDWSVGAERFNPEIPRFLRAMLAATERELQEELTLIGYEASILGLLIDNSDAVGRVHAGILSTIVIPEHAVALVKKLPDHEEVGRPWWSTQRELTAMHANGELEGWSGLALPVFAEA